VNQLARAFGGGGHKKASGATIEGALADVRERVVAAALAGFMAPAAPSPGSEGAPPR
jgi:nanoRNase/pAp phosphatase (c-di-AMP/oligoRNAs hydrolase)